MFSAEGTGKTIEKAIENALFELKATKEDVDIKILNEGGLFKKAKVLVTISEDALPKYEKHKKDFEEELKEEIEEVEQEEKEETLEEIREEAEEEKLEKEIEKQEKKLEKELKKEEKKEIKKEKKQAVKKDIDPVDFLKGLFEKAGKEVEIEVTEDEGYRTYNIMGEDLGEMIGHRGDCFYAISKLTNAVCGKQDKKILLDIGEFREKRKETLTQLAFRTASKVAKTGRYIKLEPMNPGDRRIIHTALAEDDRVTTLSKGTEPRRYVIVFPKEYSEK